MLTTNIIYQLTFQIKERIRKKNMIDANINKDLKGMTDKDFNRWWQENFHKLPTIIRNGVYGVYGLEERNDPWN